MEIKTMIQKLIEALEQQEFTFSEVLHSGAIDNWSYLQGARKGFVKTLEKYTTLLDTDYSEIDKKKFDLDFAKLQKDTSKEMLYAWKYSAGSLIIVGIIFADNLTGSEIKSLFKRLDSGVTDMMRKHVGRNNGAKQCVYATMMPVFADHDKAQKFNLMIRDFFSSHFWKQTYVSTISVNSDSETLIQGKSTLGSNWNGGIDLKLLRNYMFSNY